MTDQLPPTKMSNEDWAYNPSGKLQVSDKPKHEIYWKEFGNPHGEPVIFIHGGPGGGSDPDCAGFFDPARYRIIMFDQRGCGKSMPNVGEDLEGGMAGNITANLVEDIEKLREARGISDKAHIFGGSWGSTLAMAYAQAHPEHTQNLILRGIFLADKEDLSFFYQGNAATYALSPNDTSIPGAYRAYTNDDEYTIPQHLRDERMADAYKRAWHDYVQIIPEDKRGDMIGAYHEILHSTTLPAEEKIKAAQAWTRWEGVTSYLNHDVSDLGKFDNDPKFAVAFATIENEYFYRSLHNADPALNNLMSPDNIATLAKIPTYIVQGAHDQVCFPASARKLKTAMEAVGPVHLDYYETVAGHSMKELETNKKLTEIMEALPRMHQQTHAQRMEGNPKFFKRL